MSLKKSLAASVVICTALLAFTGPVQAEGLVQKTGKDMVKGAVKGVEQELDAGSVAKGAKQVTKGVAEAAADTVPLMTSQMVNQANVNKKAMGKVARQVTTDAIGGALNTTFAEMKDEFGKKGDGPLADTMVATTERLTAAIVRGIKAETDFRVEFPTWTFVLAFVAGGFATFLFGLGLTLLYVLFQRKRVQVVETTPPIRARPAVTMG